ncbi:MAG: hypothetical protein EBV03_09805 [Proteobacteria bacterium]|nr:hypothetical protein [Pseudomonadota bacterium]
MNQDLLYIKKLESMRADHRAIDEKIQAGDVDEFTMRRLQKVKLFMRDKIYELERMVYPDIIA